MKLRIYKGLVYALLVGGLVVAGLLAVAGGRGNTGSLVQLVPDDAHVVAQGQRIYAEHCASCHGRNLEGQPNWKVRDPEGYLPAPPHDETGHTWHHPDKLLFEITKLGLSHVAGPDYKTKMPAYENVLQNREIIAVLSFIKASWPTAIRARHNRLNAAAIKANRSSNISR